MVHISSTIYIFSSIIHIYNTNDVGWLMCLNAMLYILYKSLSVCMCSINYDSWGTRLSRILSMQFRSLTTRGHSFTTLTLTPHYCCHSPSNCISHHPLHWHSCSHWSRSHLRTLTQSLSPNHTRFISLGLPLSLGRVLYCVYHSHSDSYLTEHSQ